MTRTTCLRILETRANPADAGAFVIPWQSVDGKSYTLQAATNLAIGFDATRATGIEATPPLNTHTDNVNGAGATFYRILLED